ncbi:MAG: hypothetical protein IJD10_05420 [Clostridia bacterium]|nr:hypothetical protein [Clostridia bacterium]
MRKRFWLAVLYVVTIGLFSNIAALFIKREKLKEDRFPFRLYGWEKNGRIYDKLAIRKWKNRVPDVSRVFKPLMKKSITKGFTSADLMALVKECCVAEIVHCALIVLSLAVILICPDPMGVGLFLLCFLINLPFIMIQRYNRPQLLQTAERLKRREERMTP